MIYPYYKIFKKNRSNLIGLTGSKVKIQKKYLDIQTFCITSNEGQILIGDKKDIDSNSNSQFRINNFDKDFFHERDNLLFYGSILNKKFVLWDVWDKYNNIFLNPDEYITKYKAKEYYFGKFDIELLDKYPNCVYRFQYPLFTCYV